MANADGVSMSRGKYQFFDALRPEELTALREDIRERGCFCPIEVDEKGNILDGYHRVQICDELGIKYSKVVSKFACEKVEHSLKMNLLRRHLGQISWANAFSKLCEIRGVKLGQGKRNDGRSCKATSVTVAEVAEEVGVAERTARRRLELARNLKKHPDLVEAVDIGKMEVKRALRTVREREFGNKWKRMQDVKLPSSVRIELCDFRKLKVNAHSIDLIHCDPPYGKCSKDLWEEIGKFCSRVLKPGKLLIIYTGQLMFEHAFKSLTKHLCYVWIGALPYAGGCYPSFHPYKIQSRSCPILFLSNGKYSPTDWMQDGVGGDGPEKEHHEWQKAIKEAKYYIERLTRPGDVVMDCFLGSGTTGVACCQAGGRKFIGCDIDLRAIKISKKRIADEATLTKRSL